MSTDTKSFQIAYQSVHADTVRQLEEQLARVGFRFEHLACQQADKTLSQRVLESKARVVLLVSDNFLKSANCMEGGLAMLQKLSSESRVFPIVLDGRQQTGEGETETVETRFERVSDVIQYMNHWQDQYLDLRKQKRSVSAAEEEALNQRLRMVRTISSEIGEFLRHLRVIPHYTLEELEDKGFEQFFRFAGDAQAHAAYKALAEKQPARAIEKEASNGYTVLEQEEPESVETMPEEEDDDLPPTDLGDIPGLNLLPQEEEEEADPGEQSPEGTEQEPPESTEEADLPADSQEDESPVQQVPESPLAEAGQENDELEELFRDEPEDEPVAEIEEEEAFDPEEVLDQTDELLEEGDLKQATQLLAQAIERHPTNQLRYQYALLLLKDGQQIDEAIPQLTTILQEEPENEKALFLLGELAEVRKEYEQAKNYYEEVAVMNPDFPDIFFRLGALTLQHFPHMEKKAAKYLRQALKKDKRHADAHYYFALLQNEQLNNPEKAIKHFRRTLKYRPEHPFANYDLALLYHQLGEWEKAQKYYLRAVEINPELKTPENDEAFRYRTEAEEEVLASPKEVVFTAPPPLEEPAIEEVRRIEHPSESAGIVLITGATSGIGRATAALFAEHGYSLILTGRRSERLEDASRELGESYGVPVHTLGFDVRDFASTREAIDHIPDEWKKVDILINNAGLAKGLAPIHEGSLEHWETMIDTNIKGLLYLTRCVSPGMVERQSGHIINIGSTAGKEVYPSGNVYCATKFAVDALTKAMRLDLHRYGIRVSQVSPGHVEETEFALNRFDGDAERAKIYEDFQPLRARDVAEAIYFIATRPAHVNIQDILLMGTQQANSTTIDRSGRPDRQEEED